MYNCSNQFPLNTATREPTVNDFTFVLNPAAGKGTGAKLLGILEKILHRRGVRHSIVLTEQPGDGTRLARKADSDIVVAVGGDGTINEVANGIFGTGKILGVVPAGSGNDFIKSASIPQDPAAAIELVLSGKPATIDVGTVLCSTDPLPALLPDDLEGRCFVNGVGIGFDAAVAVRTRQIRYLTGIPLYLLAVFQTLGRYKSPLFELKIDSRTEARKHLLVAVGNGRSAGGGFFLTPDAILDDGLLDVCLIDDVSVPTILKLLPRVLWGGHRNAKQVNFKRCKSIDIFSADRFYVHADGEIVGDRVRYVRIGIKEKAIPVISNFHVSARV